MPVVRRLKAVSRLVVRNVYVAILLSMLMLSITRPPRLELVTYKESTGLLNNEDKALLVIKLDWIMKNYLTELIAIAVLLILLQLNDAARRLAAKLFIVNFVFHWLVAVMNLFEAMETYSHAQNVKQYGLFLILVHLMQLGCCLFAYFRPSLILVMGMDVE